MAEHDSADDDTTKGVPIDEARRDVAALNEHGVRPGTMLDGKYRLKKLIGKGGMGSVWLADHLNLGSEVAVKVLKPSVAYNENSRSRFIREAKAAALLRSSHVVQILDQGTHDQTVYIVMERLEGESLSERLQRDRRLPTDDVYRIINHIVRAVSRAHDAGIVHRDLKPGNVFLVYNEDEITAKVLDFGIAKTSLLTLDTTDSPQTKTGALLGTPYYVSPEQAQGSDAVDHRSDLWAIGVIAFECLCGRRPFTADSLVNLLFQICNGKAPVPSTLVSLPAGFDAWFAKAVAHDPDARYQSAKELIAALKPVLAPLTSTANTTGAVPVLEARPPLDSAAQSLAGAAPATLDALAATQSPTRTRLRSVGLLGGLVLAGAIGAVVVAVATTGEDVAPSRSKANTAESVSEPDATESPIAAPTAVSAAPSAIAVDSAGLADSASAAEAVTALPSASAPTPPRAGSVPTTVWPPRRSPRPKTTRDDNPLGI